MVRRTRRKRNRPPYRVIVTAANIDPAEAEVRINKALDVLIDEALRKRGDKRK